MSKNVLWILQEKIKFNEKTHDQIIKFIFKFEIQCVPSRYDTAAKATLNGPPAYWLVSGHVYTASIHSTGNWSAYVCTCMDSLIGPILKDYFILFGKM